jgi:heme/copper-type cytochrome/quinol oxidase subunit 2
MAGGGIFPTPSAVSAVTSASVATLSGEALDPLEKLSQQIERVIEAQNRTTNLILLIAEYFLGVFFWTFIFMWNFTRQLRDNSDAYLYFTWIIYLGGLGFFTHRARQKLYEFNLKSK